MFGKDTFTFTFSLFICLVLLIPDILGVKSVPCKSSSFFKVSSTNERVEPVSQITRVSQILIPWESRKATVCNFPLHGFAIATGFACSLSFVAGSALGLHCLSSLCKRRLWFFWQPFLPHILWLYTVHTSVPRLSKSSPNCIYSHHQTSRELSYFQKLHTDRFCAWRPSKEKFVCTVFTQ